ncbi:MAG: HAD family hydrolase [Anaerolineales bacterium]|nr:HAD family hydrolase [Anaerolineales bacterium]MCB9128471.1 HAD family hydrolase [Ardenticatenales bacterium]MCB9172689.1 HAD family hydrolase [Ardenticatenales bacterium]
MSAPRRALLLDLDDTLLHNDMADFLPSYFGALMAYVSDLMPPQEFFAALHFATQRMMASSDLSQSNEAIFWREFEPALPLSLTRERLEPRLHRFYEEEFPKLRGQTEPVAGVAALMRTAKAAGWQIAIATNPVFPRRAIEHRMAWAGVGVDQVDFVTSYENMQSTKPHASYFAQIIDELGVAAPDAVMAGNHKANDLVGAAQIGLRTFWVDRYAIDDDAMTPDGRGDLIALRHWLFNA